MAGPHRRGNLRGRRRDNGPQRSTSRRRYHQTTYYGQLARAKLGLITMPIRSIANEAKGEDREDAIKVIELLYAAGEKDLAAPLVIEAARHLADETQVAALASLVAKQRDAHLSLNFGKIVSQRGMPIDELAFPDYGVPAFEPLQNSAAPSVVYSVARQESAFEPAAVSSAGAKGLMQMILSTAKRTADHAGVAFDAKRLLTDAAFNAQLAARHLGELMAEQKGSYILTFAAYNAGGKRVKEWIDAYGDPRKPGVDPIDWVERIPVHRNPQLRPASDRKSQRLPGSFGRDRANIGRGPSQGSGEALRPGFAKNPRAGFFPFQVELSIASESWHFQLGIRFLDRRRIGLRTSASTIKKESRDRAWPADEAPEANRTAARGGSS